MPVKRVKKFLIILTFCLVVALASFSVVYALSKQSKTASPALQVSADTSNLAKNGTDYTIDNNGAIHIYTARGLNWFRCQVNGQNEENNSFTHKWGLGGMFESFNDLHYNGATVYLENDIDLKDYSNWTPIGYYNYVSDGSTLANYGRVNDRAFRGTFDGQGHTIYNLKMQNKTDDNNFDNKGEVVGLFGLVAGGNAVIKNLCLNGVSIKLEGMTATSVGTLVGNAGEFLKIDKLGGHSYNNNEQITIENCMVLNANINVTGPSNSSDVVACGGLIGTADDQLTIKNCAVQAEITNKGSEDRHARGLLGYVYCSYSYTEAPEGLTSTATYGFGKIIMQDCYFKGGLKVNDNLQKDNTQGLNIPTALSTSLHYEFVLGTATYENVYINDNRNTVIDHFEKLGSISGGAGTTRWKAYGYIDNDPWGNGYPILDQFVNPKSYVYFGVDDAGDVLLTITGKDIYNSQKTYVNKSSNVTLAYYMPVDLYTKGSDGVMKIDASKNLIYNDALSPCFRSSEKSSSITISIIGYEITFECAEENKYLELQLIKDRDDKYTITATKKQAPISTIRLSVTDTYYPKGLSFRYKDNSYECSNQAFVLSGLSIPNEFSLSYSKNGADISQFIPCHARLDWNDEKNGQESVSLYQSDGRYRLKKVIIKGGPTFDTANSNRDWDSASFQYSESEILEIQFDIEPVYTYITFSVGLLTNGQIYPGYNNVAVNEFIQREFYLNGVKQNEILGAVGLVNDYDTIEINKDGSAVILSNIIKDNKRYTLNITINKNVKGFRFIKWQRGDLSNDFYDLENDADYGYDNIMYSDMDDLYYINMRAVFQPVNYSVGLAYSANAEGVIRATNVQYNILSGANLTDYAPKTDSEILTDAEKSYLSSRSLEFSSFIIDTAKIDADLYNCSFNAGDKKFIIDSKNNDNVHIIFGYNKFLQYVDNGDTYYYVYVDKIYPGSYGDYKKFTSFLEFDTWDNGWDFPEPITNLPDNMSLKINSGSYHNLTVDNEKLSFTYYNNTLCEDVIYFNSDEFNSLIEDQNGYIFNRYLIKNNPYQYYQFRRSGNSVLLNINCQQNTTLTITVTLKYTISGTLEFNDTYELIERAIATKYYVISRPEGWFLPMGKDALDYDSWDLPMLKDAPIYARFAPVYDIKITNGTADYFDGLDNEAELQGVGGGVLNGNSDDVTISQDGVTIKVQDSGNYMYPFMTSYYAENLTDDNGRAIKFLDMASIGDASLISYITPLSFYKLNDFSANISAASNKGYYYVYNYGHQISAWVIKITIPTKGSQEVITKYLTAETDGDDGNGPIIWSLKEVQNGVIPYTPIGLLTGSNLENLGLITEFVDLIVKNGNTGDIGIEMYPLWENVSLGVTGEEDINFTNTNDGVITYGGDYELNGGTVEAGKSLAHYVLEDSTYKDGEELDANSKIAVKKAKWNYTYFNKDDFTLEFTDEGKVIYNIALRPVNLDMLFRVQLNLNGGEELTSENYVTKAEVPDARKIKTSVAWGMADYYDGWVERYLEEYKFKFNYFVNCITNKVDIYPFDNNFNLRTLYITTQGEYFIYLANNQTPILPVFSKNGFDLIAYSSDNDRDDYKEVVYTTSLYKAEEHEASVRELAKGLLKPMEKFSISYEQSADTIMFTAEYYRQFYYLQVDTLFENASGLYGYAIIKVDDNLDNTLDANYLAIYSTANRAMYYSKVGSDQLSDIFVNNKFTGTKVDNIKVYNNSVVTITACDQSSYPELFSSSNYDNMIGYRFDNFVISHEILDNNPDIYIAEYNIQELPLKTGDVIAVELNYVKITYTFTLALVDEAAGSLNYIYNGITSANFDTADITLTVGDVYLITYNAELGYEFSEDAFVLNVGGQQVVLKRYSESINYVRTRDSVIDSDKVYYALINGVYTKVNKPISANLADYYEVSSISQNYILTLNGQFLKDNYYSIADTAYTTKNATAGKLDVNTQKIEFGYLLKVYDSGNRVWLPTRELGGNNDTRATFVVGDRIDIINAFTCYDDMYIYNDSENNKYAILTSYAYNIYDPQSSSLLSKTYNFPQIEVPVGKYEVSIQNLYYMVKSNYNQIVLPSSRTFYMVLNVRELFKINLELATNNPDYDSIGNKTLSVYNVDNLLQENRKTATKINDEIKYYNGSTLGGREVKTNYIYTYFGLYNNISYTLDETFFNSATLSLNNGETDFELASNQVALSNNLTFGLDAVSFGEKPRATIIKATFIAKPLTAKINYTLTDDKGTRSTTNLSELSGVLDKFELTPNEEIYINTTLNISYALNVDYVMKVEIVDAGEDGQNTVFNIDAELNSEDLSYTVSANNYLANNVIINVEISKKNNENIIFHVVDKSSNEVINQFGEFELIINGVKTEFAQNNSYNIVESRKVELNIISVENGYVYAGYNFKGRHYDDEITIESFSQSANAGNYYILLEKLPVNISLQLDENQAQEYQLFTTNNSSTIDQSSHTITSARLGDTITLDNSLVVGERLINQVYIDGKNVEHNLTKEFTITSELLADCYDEQNSCYNLKIKLYTTKIYKLDVQIDAGEEFINSLTTDPNNMLNDKFVYFDQGTNINLKITSKIAGKYNITIRYFASGEEQVISGDEIDENITLNSDIVVHVLAERKSYDVNILENHFDTMNQLETNSPVQAENAVNNLTTTQNRFGLENELSVALRSTDYNLRQLVFSSEDAEFTLTFINDKISVYSEEDYTFKDNVIKINGLTFALSMDGDKLTINYTVTCEVNITVNYISIKAITDK